MNGTLLEAARAALTATTALPCAIAADGLRVGTHTFRVTVWDAVPAAKRLAPALAAATGTVVVLPFAAPTLARALRDAGLGYVDSVGNAWLRWEQSVVAVEGRPAPPEARRARPPERAGGLRLLLALAVDPELPGEQVRAIARASGASLGTIVNVLARLRDENLLTADAPARITAPQTLAERYATAWSGVRGAQLAARARPAPGVPVGESIEWLRGSADSLVGGEAGARLLLGEDVTAARQATLHLPNVGPATWRTLRLVPDANGPIHLVRRFAPAEVGPSIDGLPVAHPVVVSAELRALIASGLRDLSDVAARVDALAARR